ncbi:MAG: GNAT family N-acetyltransferase [Clostridia bacterium]
MRIYSFSELSEEQKRIIYQFISSFNHKTSYESYEEMTKLFGGIIFDHGSSYFSLWEDGRPVGTIGVVSKEAEARGEIFITSINMKEQDSHKLSKLLSKAYDYCSGIKTAKFRLGVTHDKYYLISELEKSGYKEIYRNLTMGYCGNNLAGVFYAENIPAGTYTLRIKDDTGWIEGIGVAPGFQGRGVGRKMLHKSIKVLQAAGAENIALSVFSSNTRALTLYKKDGFEVESEQSIWYER